MKRKTIKILITVPSLGVGGMERAALNFAISLYKVGCEVRLFTISHNEIFYDVPKEIEVINGKKRTKDIHLVPLSLFKLRRLVCKFKPNVVFSFSGKISPYVIISLLGNKTPVIPFHRSNPYITYGKINNMLSEFFYPKCKALAVQTNEAKHVFKEKYKNENIIVVPNPIRELSVKSNIKKENIIINVSRLVQGKGIDKLLRIFSSIDNDGWELYILGDGPMKSSLEAMAKDLDISNKVTFLGDKKNIDDYLSVASVFAFTSESEGFPNSLLEAMCAGLACISFDCPTGPSDIIIDGINGFLVKMDDHKDYIYKLQLITQDSRLRHEFSKEAVKLKEKHKQENIINNFLDELENLSII